MLNELVTDKQEVRQVVREELVNEAAALGEKAINNLTEAARQIVLLASDMNGDERNSLMRKLVKKNFNYDRAERMMACASRGIVDAEHLYGATRKVSAGMIRDATTKALKQIAQPDYEFAFVDDKGKSVLIQAKNLRFNVVSRVWHWESGAITDKVQRKKKQELLNTIKASTDALRVNIKSAIPLKNEEIEIRACEFDSDKEIKLIFSTRLLRKFLV